MNPAQVAQNRLDRLVAEANTPAYTTETPTQDDKSETQES